jgi:hypothetical protein
MEEVAMSRIAIISCATVLVALLTTGNATANPGIHQDWETFYGFADSNPVDDSLTDAGSTECQLCHRDSNGGQPWNAYGWELHLNDVDFDAADIVDSDGDGAVNGDEIDFLDGNGYAAQPGWTSDAGASPGNVDCVDQGPNFGCTPTASELVPATAGPLDLPEPGVTLQLVSGGMGLAWLDRRRSRRKSNS